MDEEIEKIEEIEVDEVVQEEKLEESNSVAEDYDKKIGDTVKKYVDEILLERLSNNSVPPKVGVKEADPFLKGLYKK